MGESEKTPQQESCEPGITRQEFLRRLVKGAAVTGAIIAAPKVIDKFLVPPAYAMPSTFPPKNETPPGQDA